MLLERIHAAFLASGLGEPSMLFTFSDAPVPGAFSTVDRLLKKYPEFARFTGERSIVPNTPPIRQVSNRPDSLGAGESVPFSTLLAVAAGVPRSLPFHAVSIHFHSPAFGVQFPLGNMAPINPGRDGDRLVVGQRPKSRRERADERRGRSCREETAAAARACGRRARRVREDQEDGAGAARRGRRVGCAAAIRAAVARSREGGDRGHPRLPARASPKSSNARRCLTICRRRSKRSRPPALPKRRDPRSRF